MKEAKKDTAQVGASRSRLTERDLNLIGAVGLARFLSTEQLQHLFFPERHPNVVRRRLAALAGEGIGAFPHPLLRRLHYLTADARRISVWGITQPGLLQAQRVLSGELKPGGQEVRPEFLEHAVVLNDLLVGLLARRGNREGAPLDKRGQPFPKLRVLAFRWHSIETVRLPWAQYDAAAGKARERLILPDAMLELPAQRRRVFVECEMGTHSIAAASDEKQGATIAKLERYDEYVHAPAGDVRSASFYAKAFPDGIRPEVLFLVQSVPRAAAVNAAIANWRKGRGGTSVSASAMGLATALREYGGPGEMEPPPTSSTGGLTLAESDLALLRGFYAESVAALKNQRARARERQEVPPEYPKGTQDVQRLLQRLSTPGAGS